ncbi:MAG TPA: NAD+ synthase [Alkalispirochaeta sp.]|nr:NAD+ synthase [Alkalispirochaeta sp.]
MSVKVALGQINSTIGDFTGNGERIREATVRARSEGAELIVFPELSLCGYPPMDLLDYEAFVEENITALRRLQQTLPPDIAVVVGYVDRTQGNTGKSLQNVAAVVLNGEVVFRQAKRLLPTYDVFDEARYFEPAPASQVWEYGSLKIGIAICEDIWWETEPVPGTRYPVDPVHDLLDAGAQLILSPSASPFYSGKLHTRARLVSSIGRTNSVPVLYVNMVGGNDSLIFDGYSFATDRSGAIRHLSPGFSEHVALVETSSLMDSTAGRGTPPAAPLIPGEDDRFAELERALVLGLRDYLAKTGFSRVHLGLSGGIDSAVVAVIAARAVGPENVRVFLMPSQYSSSGSITDSEQLARTLNVAYRTLPILPVYDAFAELLREEFADTAPGIAEENIQARTRGNLLMAWSNKFGSLTLTTGNKSELAVGYCTLYGDMSGGLGVIGDLLKTEVYDLARHMNRDAEVIPEAIITKPPSAELRADQKDEDSLPSYDILDGILHRYLILNQTYPQIVDAGFDTEIVSHILHLVGRSEYKRRQAPPVLKVSPRAFGNGRRMPIARTIFESRR